MNQLFADIFNQVLAMVCKEKLPPKTGPQFMSVLNEDAVLIRAIESIAQMYYGITAQNSYFKRRDPQDLLKFFSFN